MSDLEEENLDSVVTIRDAAGSQRTQNDQVRELIDAGCNVLCVNLVDRADPSEIIDLARESDVPIIFFNREPVAEDLQQWDKMYYVGADAKESGVMQGETRSGRDPGWTVRSTAIRMVRYSMSCLRGSRDIRMRSSGRRMLSRP